MRQLHTQRELELVLLEEIKAITQWLLRRMFTIGIYDGRCDKDHSLGKLSPRYNYLYLIYWKWQGGWNISLRCQDYGYPAEVRFEISRAGNDLFDYRLFKRDSGYSYQEKQFIAMGIDAFIEKLLPGLEINQSLRICQSTFCKISVDQECKKWGDRWLCDKCQKHLMLTIKETKITEGAKQNGKQAERDKMTNSLRFKILERDDFTCCACGASPHKDSSVTLHVDHIIPIAKGGKTIEDNLQVLCQSCNLAKSDGRIEQMELWNR